VKKQACSILVETCSRDSTGTADVAAVCIVCGRAVCVALSARRWRLARSFWHKQNPETVERLVPFCHRIATMGLLVLGAEIRICTFEFGIMSEFGFTGVSAVQPGSETCAPSP